MPRLLAMLVLLDLALIVAAMIDCLSFEPQEIRGLPRPLWVVLILFASPVGPVLWFMAGRPVRTAAVGRAPVWRPGAGSPESERPRAVAPDDDPDFLAGLSRGGDSRGGRDEPRGSRREDEELLRRWEEDLRRREDELRGKNGLNGKNGKNADDEDD